MICFLINKSIPAMDKITNNIISNNSLEMDIEAPKNAKGIDPNKVRKKQFKIKITRSYIIDRIS